jgi:dTDP-4-dehydrorhamnose 3,5-epimerase-like enzyme
MDEMILVGCMIVAAGAAHRVRESSITFSNSLMLILSKFTIDTIRIPCSVLHGFPKIKSNEVALFLMLSNNQPIFRSVFLS